MATTPTSWSRSPLTTTWPDQPQQGPGARRVRISVVNNGGAYGADNVQFVA
jgi:hypothetical protein